MQHHGAESSDIERGTLYKTIPSAFPKVYELCIECVEEFEQLIDKDHERWAG